MSHRACGAPRRTCRASYDPNAAISLWQKMTSLGDPQSPQFLFTYPSYASRIDDLRVCAARVVPLYEQTRSAR
ncbi:MAG TPA: hypothetical protein VEH51_02840 [Burkholderiales bacterium]|nr:hypothetical protein [Burkholderiales bacterium]